MQHRGRWTWNELESGRELASLLLPTFLTTATVSMRKKLRRDLWSPAARLSHCEDWMIRLSGARLNPRARHQEASGGQFVSMTLPNGPTPCGTGTSVAL